MRIVCQKCSAAYAIDDKFITAKGVRAQCPRCRHLQLVKKDDPQPPEAPGPSAAAAAPEAPAAAPEASAFLFDLDGPPPPPPAAPPRPSAPPPAAAVPAPSSIGTELDFGELDLGAPPPPGDELTPAANGALDFSGDFSLGPPEPASDPLPVRGAPPAPPKSEPLPPATGVKCRSCGKALTDPFDQAIGVCDDCRAQADTGSQIPPPPPPPPRASRPVVSAAPVEPPGPSAPLAPALSPPTTGASRRVSSPTAVKTAVRVQNDDDGPGPGGGVGAKIAIAVVAVVVLAGVGTVLAVKKPWVHKAPPLAKQTTGGDRPIEKAIEAWKLRFVDDLSGSSADHLAAGEEQFVKDTTAGYLEAEEQFEKALVLDKGNDRAIAGWVLAMSFGRGTSIDDEMARTAEEMLVAAEHRSGAGRLYTAHAHLLLVRSGNMNDIKVMAEMGKNSPSDGDKALALLALGQSMISKNPQYAAESFKEALKLDPKLKRAYLSQSQLLLSLGRYREAVTDIEKRLELDPDQWEGADALARTWIEVGEVGKAKKVYERVHAADPRNFRARLALAVLAYQHEGNLESAAAQFDAIAADEDKLESKDLVEALGHRAATLRLSGDLAGAIASAEKAMALKAMDPHVNLQRFLIALEQGSAPDARAQWPFIKGKLSDDALEGTLEGLLVLKEGNANGAMKLFAAAADKDPRRTDALLLAGAAAAKAKNEGKAWEFVLKRALKVDPRTGGPMPAMARFYVRSADLLKAARGAFEPLSKEAEDPNPPIAEGLVAWHANDYLAAEKFFAKVTSFDTANGNGLAFRALLALRRKEIPNALKLATRAVASDRQLALTHYALGMALLTSNQFEQAKPEFATAFATEPTFVSARVKLAEIETKQKKPDEARKILSAVLLIDPLCLEAKKALYALP